MISKETIDAIRASNPIVELKQSAAAIKKEIPQLTKANMGSPPYRYLIIKPPVNALKSCGSTMKKLKIPIYTPIFRAGIDPTNMA